MSWEEIYKIAFAVITSFGGGALILYLLTNWLAKLQLNRILQDENAKHKKELEEIKSELQKSSFAFSKQYEEELFVYKELWRFIVDLYSSAKDMRKVIEFIDPKESVDDRAERKLGRFYNAEHEAKRSIIYNKPFYNETIYNLCQELLTVCWDEALEYEHSEQYTSLSPEGRKDFWESAKSNTEQIISLSDKICNSIKSRLASVGQSIDPDRK